MMQRKSFVFNLAWCEVLEGYPAEVRYEVYDAIIGYARSGKLSELKPLAAMAFAFIKREMDENFVRYDATVEARREAGKKGNETRWGKEKTRGGQGVAKTANATNLSQKSQMRRGTHLDNDNDNDDEYECDDILSNRQAVASSHRKRHDAAAAAEEEKDVSHKKERGRVLEMVEYYNSRIGETGARLRRCETLSERRVAAIGARMDEHGEQKVRAMIDKAVASRFLNYEAHGAPMAIDWLMRPNNFPKVLDGNYDNDNKPKRGGGGTLPRDYKGEEEKWK